jgi:hypothetical protein
MLFRKIILVHSENHTEHINTIRFGENSELLEVSAGGNHYVRKVS